MCKVTLVCVLYSANQQVSPSVKTGERLYKVSGEVKMTWYCRCRLALLCAAGSPHCIYPPILQRHDLVECGVDVGSSRMNNTNALLVSGSSLLVSFGGSCIQCLLETLTLN